MNDAEKKLAEYRARKERQAKYNQFKSNLKRKLGSYFGGGSETRRMNQESTVCLLKSETDEEEVTKTCRDDLSETNSSNLEDDERINCCTYMDCVYYILWFILWATVYAIFIKLQFGTVYLISSGLIGIYFNTRTGPKTKGEVSAYSVFNKDCKSIDGTLKAEQFEREIRYGPSTIR